MGAARLFGDAPPPCSLSGGLAPEVRAMRDDGGSAPVLTLLLAPGSSLMAPRIALREVGAPFEACPLSFARKENRGPAHLAINPEGKVPTLLVDGRRPLTEVAGILFYLARRFPDAGLLPDDGIEAEAEVVSWMSFLAATVHPARPRGGEHARAVWTIAERRLGGREWAVGGRLSIADIHLFRLFWRFHNSAGMEPGEFPALSAHHDRMLARPAVRATIEAEAAIGYELPA